MSRTTRKRKYPATGDWIVDVNWIVGDFRDDPPTKKDIAIHHSDNGWSYSLPHYFRNEVNRIRRRKDKREIYKAITLFEYEEQCSRWNCKDNNAWGYW